MLFFAFMLLFCCFFFFSSRRRHTRSLCDWSSDVCSSDLAQYAGVLAVPVAVPVGLGAKESYIAQLRRQIVAAGAVGILAPDELADFAVAAAAGTSARLAGAM